MKNTKNTLLSIAIIAALPFTANATQTIVETNTPAAVGANGTVKKAADSGPYQTATIGEHDDEHIATTAYVKGAYNDAIAAVNKVDSDKQVKLKSFNGSNGSEQDIEPKVMGPGFNGVGGASIMFGTSQEGAVEYAAMTEDVAYYLTGVHDNAAALNDTLISAGTVMQWMREAGDAINAKPDASDLAAKQDQIVVLSSNGANQPLTTTPIVPKLLGGLNSSVGQLLVEMGTSQESVNYYNEMAEDLAYNVTGVHNNAAALDNTLVSLGAVMGFMRGAGDEIKTKQNKLTTIGNQDISSTVAQTVNTTTPSATTLVSEAAVAVAMNNYATNTALNSKRVEIYTTWGVDDGTATALVPFATAQ